MLWDLIALQSCLEMIFKRTSLPRIKYILIISFCFSFLPITAQTKVDSIRMKILTRDESSILVAAHRGHWRYTTENSLSAIKHAIEIGADIVEIDIQRTKDGHFILMHDETLDRTTTGQGRVDSVNLDYIKSLKLKNEIGIPITENIPTLKEVFESVNGEILLNIDKADRYIDQILQLVINYNMQKAVIIKTNMPFADVRVRFHDYLQTSILLMPIIDLDSQYAEEEITSYLNFFKPKIMELIFSTSDKKKVEKIAKNLKGKTCLWYNTMWDHLSGGLTDDYALENEDAVYGYMINSLGANIIQTDRPTHLLDYLSRKK